MYYRSKFYIISGLDLGEVLDQHASPEASAPFSMYVVLSSQQITYPVATPERKRGGRGVGHGNNYIAFFLSWAGFGSVGMEKTRNNEKRGCKYFGKFSLTIFKTSYIQY